ncbi:anaerobic sulfatase-maturation protein [Bacteroidales bacterium OttesenSCG-928-B11]|nr:anaerobic sulfatase-maturation protein [Bacteroidales bacterium OttesenSCG-928-C03]MDL2312385.1 anaerobic sulfatase-maturation protein [Bacteroidales bacterium OttesenSCG-928-B11]MDL2326641.1 anaerobic sulfatase-maturation protein [Bacteroidales bacterium OttesenSCG-928-A14]
MTPRYVMSKPISATCNLSCDYCYYLEKDRLYNFTSSKQMSETVLERFVSEYIAMQPVPEVLFAWHGGEPLLRGIDFYRKALKFQHYYGRGRKIENTLQTNGLLLNDEWCRFFKEHNFLIGISIDGPEHCHDVFRKRKDGSGSFQSVMKGIELLKKHGVEFNTLSVIHSYNVDYPLEVYHFLKKIGSGFLQFAPIVERTSCQRTGALSLLSAKEDYADAVLTPESVDPVKFGQFYISIFDEWIKYDVGKYFVQLFDATLANRHNGQPGVCVLAHTCGNAAAMEFNGDLYACDHFVFPDYYLGNIQEQTLLELMFSEKIRLFGKSKQTSLPTNCLRCDYLHLCHGECPKNRIVKTDEKGKNLNYLCRGYKAFFKHTAPQIEAMHQLLLQGKAPAEIMR